MWLCARRLMGPAKAVFRGRSPVVQWNAGYYPRDGTVWLGVNLEGMKYDDWPVARLIEREISRPLLLTRYRPQVARPDKVTVLWSRDAWQYSARRPIKGGEYRPHAGRAGSPRRPGLGGSTARREGVSGPPEAASRPQEGRGHAARSERHRCEGRWRWVGGERVTCYYYS